MAFSLKNLLSSLPSAAAKEQSAVGIDIGRSAIKVVELERDAEAPLLKTYGEIQLGPYQQKPIGASIDADSELLETAVVDVFREAGVQANQGTLSLPISAGFVTVVDITVQSDETLESRIPVEARKFVPLPMKEITLDWAPIGKPTVTEDKAQVHSVLLVALQNESVVSYRDLLSNIKLAQQPMELAMFSAARSVGAYETANLALIDAGASMMKVYIYLSGTLAAIHRFSAGGEAVTAKLAELQGITVAAAEELKRTPSADTAVQEDIRRAMSAVYDSPLREVNRVLKGYETNHQLTLEEVQLSGGVARSAGYNAYVSDVLQRKTTRAFPFAYVGYPAFMEDVLREIGPSFTNSLGAALRQIQ